VWLTYCSISEKIKQFDLAGVDVCMEGFTHYPRISTLKLPHPPSRQSSIYLNITADNGKIWSLIVRTHFPVETARERSSWWIL